uniref:FimV/HubP family polar landmark protein n=1 Tax=Shewanella sp. TaxID=50422 RepID=UPI003D0BA8A0
AEFEPQATAVEDDSSEEQAAQEETPQDDAPSFEAAEEAVEPSEVAHEEPEQEEVKTSALEPLAFELDEAPADKGDADKDDEAVDLDALLADLESAEESEDTPKSDKGESGFFDDLKGNKRSNDNMLEWDASALTGAESSADEPLDDDDDSIALQLDDDDSLTVDQALAALDAAEKKHPARAVPEHDLTAFQQDNGFIDIDRLLNEADEEQLDVDQYKELDVDMGELDNLMGNATMVDVDDEENAVNAKLDLARAYIEIDDMDSAKALLKEVELDGNDRQQAEAKKLLDDL